jgi:hypothetical protein
MICMGRIWWQLAATALMLVLAAMPARGDEEASAQADAAEHGLDLRGALLHPLAHIRTQAGRALAGNTAGRATVAELQGDADPRLRAAAWAVVQLQPDWCRPQAARQALDDTCPRVRLGAARALLLHLTSQRV